MLTALEAGQRTCAEAAKQLRMCTAARLAARAAFPNGSAVAVALGELAGHD